MIFRFIAAKKAEHSIKTIRARGVAIRFHAWQRRAPSARALEDERRTARIREIHQANRRVYGSPRIHAELVLGDGERIGRKRVERLMRQAGLSGLIARKRGRTTIRVPGVRVCEDLVDRAFLASAPDRLWGRGRNRGRGRSAAAVHTTVHARGDLVPDTPRTTHPRTSSRARSGSC